VKAADRYLIGAIVFSAAVLVALLMD